MSRFRRLLQSLSDRQRTAEAQARAARRERYLAAVAAELKGATHA